MNLFRRFLQVGYSPLPTTTKSNSQQMVVLLLPKRYIRLFLLVLAACAVVIFLYASKPIRPPDYPEVQLTSPDKASDLPPLYEEYRNYEDRLSEWSMKTYGKADDRYLYISNHASGAGWGNVMQEMVFSSLLASGSGRGYGITFSQT